MNLNLKHILIIFLLTSSVLAFGQDSIQLKGMQEVTAFSIDAKGFYYLADKSNTIYKLDQNGKVLTNVNTKVYGEVTSIDCSNPFEIYAYYQGQNILVYFDNMLNIRGETRFNDLGLNTVSLAARSYDNGIWVYDYSDFQLKKLNKEGKVQASSGNLSRFHQGDLNPVKIVDHQNKVFLANQSGGILVFDMFGTYLKTLALDSALDLLISDSSLYVLQKGQVQSYNMVSFSQKIYQVNKGAQFIGLFRKELFYLRNTTIYRLLRS